MNHNHIPGGPLADLMRRYELNGSLKNGRAFADAILVYFLGPREAKALIDGEAKSEGGNCD